MPVDVQRLRVERHVGEQHVVHLRHGAGVAVLDQLADREILEIEPAALVADRGLDRHVVLLCVRRRSSRPHDLNGSFTITADDANRAAGERAGSPARHGARNGAAMLRRQHRNARRGRDRRDPQRGARDRRRLPIPAGDRPGRIGAQSRPPRSSSSSAKGLFQFIDQTWLTTLKESGPALGYGRYADAIAQTPSGHYAVPDPAMRQQIMALRDDPAANAAMAGAFTQQNAAELRQRIGRDPSEGDLYVAHFLGAAGASQLINARRTRVRARPRRACFPSAAKANPSIFYDRQGHARSVERGLRTCWSRATTWRARSPRRAGRARLRPTSRRVAPVAPRRRRVARGVAGRRRRPRRRAAVQSAPELPQPVQRHRSPAGRRASCATCGRAARASPRR